ncbi:MAG: chemotaxis response regulator protein-glutamate methylesterase [Rhodospirillales bacterium]|nr:chemotaxis response regulator protein-glutamate methylesterase [Rhodospirillales bacterium]
MAPTLAAKRADAPAHHRGSRPIRALIVDDSAVVRGLVSRLLAEQPDIEIAATASNGEQALKALAGARFDVVVLDVEMPVMDGLTALPKMLAIDPDVRVIIASTLSKPGAAITIRALAAGAADYIPKPSASRDLTSAATDGDGFRRDLVIKVRALGEAGRRRRDQPAPGVGSEEVAEGLGSASWPLRRTPPTRPEILVIGSSTGGPQALSTLVGGLPADLTLPILIAQHMPPHFTAILAEHLARIGRRPCAEGRDGEPIQPGRIYVAPGDFHMIVGRDGRRRVIRINQAPPENFCRPAVDALFRSAAACYGAATLAVVLTGIGADGTRGGEAVVAAAGALIAQDEASSVVWGMPGSVARAGLCSAVLPLEALAERIGHLATGLRP